MIFLHFFRFALSAACLSFVYRSLVNILSKNSKLSRLHTVTVEMCLIVNHSTVVLRTLARLQPTRKRLDAVAASTTQGAIVTHATAKKSAPLLDFFILANILYSTV